MNLPLLVDDVSKWTCREQRAFHYVGCRFKISASRSCACDAIGRCDSCLGAGLACRKSRLHITSPNVDSSRRSSQQTQSASHKVLSDSQDGNQTNNWRMFTLLRKSPRGTCQALQLARIRLTQLTVDAPKGPCPRPQCCFW